MPLKIFVETSTQTETAENQEMVAQDEAEAVETHEVAVQTEDETVEMKEVEFLGQRRGSNGPYSRC